MTPLKPLQPACRRIALAAILFACTVSAAFAAEARREIERTFPASAGTSISVLNLAGDITVVPASGSSIRVAATVHAEGTSQSEAERLADLLTVVFDDSGGKISVKAKYPLDTYTKYAYPRRAEHQDLPWWLEWLPTGSTTTKYDGRTVRVVGQPSSGAPTLFADFRIEIPAGTRLAVDNVIGEIAATGVVGDVDLELGSGGISARQGSGALTLETGSGDVTIANHQGTVTAESGSGDIEVADLRGGVSAETGSGDVTLERVRGDRVKIDTGSGDVRLVDVDATLNAETGSGNITGEGLVAGASVSTGTGSGDVRIAGDFGAVTRLSMSTGSGNIVLEASRAPQLTLAVSTGSGDISVDLPDTRITRSGDHDLRAAIGAATGSGAISTGSGDVTLRAGN